MIEANKILSELVDLFGSKQPDGALHFHAEVDGWKLALDSSDFGDVMVSMRKPGVIIAFEEDQDGQWYPITINTGKDELTHLANLASRANWTAK